MFKKVAKHWKRYNPYALYAAKSELKGEVGNSYLTWAWWVLDPVFFMLVYVFITVVVFRSKGAYLPVIVIIGLTVWNFFNKMLMISVKIVNTFRGLASKIYIPKYMLIMEKVYVNLFKMMISFGIVAVFSAAYHIPPTVRLLYCVPLFFLLLFMSFSLCVLVAHLGVYINDLYNVVQVILRFLFYLSGVFYDVGERLSSTTVFGVSVGRLLLAVNPVAYIIDEFRRIIIYGKALRPELFVYWSAIAAVLLVLGLRLMYRHENSYIKVV